uniref:Uncharacterized protein n=1 Tax=viral metagenome TaxID=1070528 RepID=A0A6C0BY37_9ZZZZ
MPNTFMEEKFQHLPNDIQTKIMIHHAHSLPPRPKFKNGQRVRYKPEVVKAMKQAMNGACQGPFPFGELIIYGDPIYIGNGDWKCDYEYGYGLTSEGSTYESRLIAY